jgi:hypothetical protein
MPTLQNNIKHAVYFRRVPNLPYAALWILKG